jgi:hypothetical protein
VLSCKPPDGSIYDWCPLQSGVKLDNILNKHNEDCFQKYRTIWDEENVEKLKGIKAIQHDLSDVDTLSEEDFKMIDFLLFDLDEIGKNQEILNKLNKVRRKLDKANSQILYLQVSTKSDAIPCPPDFIPNDAQPLAQPFWPDLPNVINNIDTLKKALSSYCSIIGRTVKKKREVISNE